MRETGCSYDMAYQAYFEAEGDMVIASECSPVDDADSSGVDRVPPVLVPASPGGSRIVRTAWTRRVHSERKEEAKKL